MFLFVLLLLTGGAGIYFTVILKKDAKTLLQDNYESIGYGHKMQQQLDSLAIDYAKSVEQLETALTQEEGNITERGEADATHKLRAELNSIKNGDTTRRNLLATRAEIQKILAVNMNAIEIKNKAAQKTARRAMTIIIVLAGIVFLIAFTFSVNFPSVVTDPIQHFLEATKAIGDKNYKHRIHIENKDEFGELANSFNKMAERLAYFENSNLNKLMFEKSRAEAVINSLKDASIGIDKDNNVLFANYEALQLLGLKSEEVVGKTTGDISSRNDLFKFLMLNESSAPFKIVVDNRENYFTKEVVEIAQGEGNSKVIVLKNITPFKELDVAKTNFIATISHELKTPLAASDFSLKLLEDERIGKLSEEQKELIQNLKHDNQRVLKILSELLSLSQVETGRIQLDVQLVNPYLIIDNAVETIAATAKERNINIQKALQDGLPLIQADAEKTTWVLNNFLTNAIKYSKEGSEIEILATKQNGDVTFSVKDHGPGIAQEYHSRLFERYFQVPGAIAKGTGLGLGISKEFIEAQKGKIWVDSEIGQGAVFSFSLPAVVSS
jgi:PAS domain S-box-containing protein